MRQGPVKSEDRVLKPSAASLPLMARRFVSDRRGNVAMMFGLAAVPLAMMVGMGVDVTRQHTLRNSAQSSIDAAVLAAASSGEKTEAGMKRVFDEYLAANMTGDLARDYDAELEYDGGALVKASLNGQVDTFFGGLFGRQTADIAVEAAAERGSADAVELVLVLDNTDSMNQTDAGGQTRIAALKAAAAELVEAVKENEDADVKIGVVPYGEYVNVGKSNRGASWLRVLESDQLVPGQDNGTYPATESYCVAYGPSKTVTWVENRDGYSITHTGTDTPCTAWGTRPHPQAGQKIPSSAAYTIKWRWEGCVYSRIGAMRLNDGSPMVPYYGIVEPDGQPDCMTEIQPLTDSKSATLGSITGMRTWVSGRVPQTYIPAGLLWGINVLSPSAPFTQAKPYSSGNRSPRKIMVLMTDGENTMRFRQDLLYGVHETTGDGAELRKTNDDVTALCDYAKSKDIELYTVSLGVSGSDAVNMMRGCASKPDQFFNAADNAALRQAFRDIATSINRIKLVK